MVPYVCGNVAVLAERAELPEVAHSIPEPGTWGRRGRRSGRHGVGDAAPPGFAALLGAGGRRAPISEAERT